MTDDTRILKCLLPNRDMLAEMGTYVPPLHAYRGTFRDIILHAEDPDFIEIFHDSIMPPPAQAAQIGRIVLTNQHFFGTPKMGVAKGVLYNAAVNRIYATMAALPDAELEFYFCIRDLASFLPEMMMAGNYESMQDMLGETQLGQIRWAEMIANLRNSFPFMPMTIWCNEDLPFVWGEVIRDMAGLNPTAAFRGEFKLLTEIMAPEGLKRLEQYVEAQPNIPEAQKRRVIAAFLDKYAIDEAIHAELELPGWTEEIQDYLSAIYEEDVETIGQIPGVSLITP